MDLQQAVVQDSRDNKVLRIGYVNCEALLKMKESGEVFLYDADKKSVFPVEGGEYFKPLKVESLIPNVEGTAYVIKALPEGSTTGADTFRGEKNIEDLAFLSHLQDFIEKRKREMPEGSYTTKLFTKGVNKIAQKVGEEAVETVIEAIDGNRERYLYEASDLIYHLLVLNEQMGFTIADMEAELTSRHK